MTTETQWRAHAIKTMVDTGFLGPNRARDVLNALIAAGYVTPPKPDAVREGHVRWCIPVQRGEDGSIFIDGEQRVRGWFTRYPDHPVIATIIADMPLPSEPPEIKGKVKTP